MRPNILRNFTERTVHTPSPHLDSNGLGRRWVDKLAQLDVEVWSTTVILAALRQLLWPLGVRCNCRL